jgi:hypothetical protein
MLAFVVGLTLWSPSAVTLALLAASYIALEIQIRGEEAFLERMHGAAYRAYCARPPLALTLSGVVFLRRAQTGGEQARLVQERFRGAVETLAGGEEREAGRLDLVVGGEQLRGRFER